ncbi:hypothetical protein, partial [Nocardia abscessus]|uniref:hypothetical protein n=1 Tax=Nocardia abscessus TaxID=120957 RepID=UPI0024580360
MRETISAVSTRGRRPVRAWVSPRATGGLTGGPGAPGAPPPPPPGPPPRRPAAPPPEPPAPPAHAPAVGGNLDNPIG